MTAGGKRRTASIAVALAALGSAIALVGVVRGATDTQHRAAAKGVRYVAVGDSYSFGSGTTPEQSWPALLTNDLHRRGIPINLVANTAQPGATSQDVLDSQLSEYDGAAPTFATLMIGVNDTYRGVTVDQFRAQLRLILDQMQGRLPVHDHLIVITIPDYSRTPQGAQYAHMNDGGAKVVLFNDILRREAAARHLPLVDLFALSQEMGRDRRFLADDGLHPSAAEYARWEQRILPAARGLFTPSTKESLGKIPRPSDH